LGIELNVEAVIAINVVRTGLSVIEVGKWSVVVGISRVMSPTWLVFDLGVELNI